MFPISLHEGFVLYLLLTLSGLAAVYIYETWRSRTHEWHVSEERVCRCPDCNCAFLVGRTVTSTRCPRCNRLCAVRHK